MENITADAVVEANIKFQFKMQMKWCKSYRIYLHPYFAIDSRFHIHSIILLASNVFRANKCRNMCDLLYGNCDLNLHLFTINSQFSELNWIGHPLHTPTTLRCSSVYPHLCCCILWRILEGFIFLNEVWKQMQFIW